ncbi:RodZ domain-containing protein [Ferrimonas gelatinilytica]|uniref:Cytoskeleton protein RodZ n=1 Tax=Ferrimonas gelatinilytica TaxID=1255257 RepID=A0ABP9S5I0_9GAMM
MTDERQNEQGPETPGPMLKQAREQAGLTTQQVAQRLNLRHSVVSGIEQDDYESNMSITYVRGYIRNYARLVGLDEERLNRALAQLRQPETTSEMQSFSGRTHRQKSDSRWTMISWAIFFLFAGAVVWAIFGRNAPLPEGEQPQAELTTESSLSDSAAVPALERSVPEQAVEEEAALPAVEPVVSDQPVASETSTAAQSIEASAPQEPVAELSQDTHKVREADAQQTPIQATAAQAPMNEEVTSVAEATVPDVIVQDSIAVSLSDDCWMLIQDADGKVLLEGLKRGGYRGEVSGKAPFSLRIGAPQVVSLSFNGDAIDLSSYRAGRVARLTLPQ